MVGADALRQLQGQFIIGCTSSEMSLWEPILRSVGVRVDRAGEVGDASRAETPILLASMFGVVTAAYAAAAALKQGLLPEISAHYIQMSAPGSEYFLPNLMARNYEQCLASVDNFVVVSQAAVDAAREIALPTAALEPMAALFKAAQARQFGPQDCTAIVEVLLDQA